MLSPVAVHLSGLETLVNGLELLPQQPRLCDVPHMASGSSVMKALVEKKRWRRLWWCLSVPSTSPKKCHYHLRSLLPLTDSGTRESGSLQPS